MSTLTYYLKICDLEILEDLLGTDWKKNLTVEQIMYIKNKTSPFVFCEVVLHWILDLKPCSAVISLMIDEMMSFRLSYWFYFDMATELFKMGYLRQRHIFNKLSSVKNYKYDRQSWFICKENLQNFSDMKEIKLCETCQIKECNAYHSVTVQLAPWYDNKIRLIKGKFSSLNNEHRHLQYCHWYLILSNVEQSEETLFLSTTDIEDVVNKIQNSVTAKICCLLTKH